MAKGWIVVVFLTALLLNGCGGSSDSSNFTGPVSISGVFAGQVDLPGVGPSTLTLSLEGRDNTARGQVVVLDNSSRFWRSELTSYEKLSDGHRIHAAILKGE